MISNKSKNYFIVTKFAISVLFIKVLDQNKNLRQNHFLIRTVKTGVSQTGKNNDSHVDRCSRFKGVLERSEPVFLFFQFQLYLILETSFFL